MNLKALNIEELDQRIKSLAQKERDVLCEILLTIKEIDCRRTYLELGFPSLFEYLTKSVGYSEGSAQRRIDAARLLHEVPEVAPKIQSGEIKLSQISLIQKASREVARTQSVQVTVEDKKILLEQVSNLNHLSSQLEVASFFDFPVRNETTAKIQSDESVRVELTLSKELQQKIQHAQELLSHSLPSSDLVQFLEFVSERIIKQKTTVRAKSKYAFPKVGEGLPESTIEIDLRTEEKSIIEVSSRVEVVGKAKTKNKSLDKTQAEIDGADPQETEGTATVAVSSITYKKILSAQKCCQFKDKSGRQCGSKWHLQVDHIKPRWAGGGNGLENLQLLCAQHNRLKYRTEAGVKIRDAFL